MAPRVVNLDESVEARANLTLGCLEAAALSESRNGAVAQVALDTYHAAIADGESQQGAFDKARAVLVQGIHKSA